MQDRNCNYENDTVNENGYVMSIAPIGNSNVLTVLDFRNEKQSMLVGTIMKMPNNVSQDVYQLYKNRMIHLYETYGICSVSQNPDEFDGTYSKVA